PVGSPDNPVTYVRIHDSRFGVRAYARARTAHRAILRWSFGTMLGDKSMLGHRTRIVASRALVIGAAEVVARVLGSGIASASVAVNQRMNGRGNFPIIGKLDPVTTTTTATLPSPVTHGVASANFPVSVKIDAPALATTGLETVGAAKTSGTAKVK